jgi:hypothetical protein
MGASISDFFGTKLFNRAYWLKQYGNSVQEVQEEKLLEVKVQIAYSPTGNIFLWSASPNGDYAYCDLLNSLEDRNKLLFYTQGDNWQNPNIDFNGYDEEISDAPGVYALTLSYDPSKILGCLKVLSVDRVN